MKSIKNRLNGAFKKHILSIPRWLYAQAAQALAFLLQVKANATTR